MIGTLVEIVAAWPRQLVSPQVLYTDAAVPAGSEACSVAGTVLDMAALPGPEASLAGIEPERT